MTKPDSSVSSVFAAAAGVASSPSSASSSTSTGSTTTSSSSPTGASSGSASSPATMVPSADVVAFFAAVLRVAVFLAAGFAAALATPAFVAAFLAVRAAAALGAVAASSSVVAAARVGAVFAVAVVVRVADFVAAAVVLRAVATVPPLVPVRVFFVVLECGASTTISMSWASRVVRTGFICFRSSPASTWARAISVPVMVPLVLPLTRSCMIASCWNTFGRVLGAPAVVALGTDAVAFRHRSRRMSDPNPGMHHHNEREWGLVPEELGLSESIPVSSSRWASCDPVLVHYKTAYALRANARPTRVPRTGVRPARTGPDDVPERGSVALDREHRAARVEQDALRVGPEDQLADRAAATQADDDEVGLLLLGDGDEVLGGVVAPDELAHLVLQALLLEERLHPGELALELAGLVRVEVLAAPVGADDDELRSTQDALLGGSLERRATFLGGDITNDDGHFPGPPWDGNNQCSHRTRLRGVRRVPGEVSPRRRRRGRRACHSAGCRRTGPARRWVQSRGRSSASRTMRPTWSSSMRKPSCPNSEVMCARRDPGRAACSSSESRGG